MEVKKIMQSLEQKHPGEAEYLQAVHEVLESVEEVYNFFYIHNILIRYVIIWLFILMSDKGS